MFRFLLITVCLFSSPAFAHVTANPNKGEAGKYFETAFRVSHGCEGSDTVSVSVKLPKGTVTAKPQYKHGWNVEVKKSKLEKPLSAGHGKMTDLQIDEIIWSGGPLPDSQYDSFGVLMKLPEKPGETLWFPVTQKCEKGELNWVEIPAEGQKWHELKAPAPYVTLEGTAPSPNHQH